MSPILRVPGTGGGGGAGMLRSHLLICPQGCLPFCRFKITLSPELKGDGPRKEVHTGEDMGWGQGGEGWG